MSLDEAEDIVGRVSEVLDPEAQVSWGVQVSDDLKRAVRVMVILSGVHSPHLPGPGEEPSGGRTGRGEEGTELRLGSLG